MFCFSKSFEVAEPDLEAALIFIMHLALLGEPPCTSGHKRSIGASGLQRETAGF
jgi:hypothetical protein